MILNVTIAAAAALTTVLLTPLACIYVPQRKLEGRRYSKTKPLHEKGKVKLIAHRGLSGLYLENTVEAFEAAGQKGYYGIETDVHVTKDGKFIVTHDDDLKRIAGLDLIVEETDYETLRGLRFQDPYGKGIEEYRLPSLEEYLRICKKYDKQAILELKNKMRPQEVLAIAKEVEKLGWLHRTTFISFAGENLVELRKGFPDADAQYLVEKVGEKELAFMKKYRLDCDLKWSIATKKTVKRLHEQGIKINCWTVDGVACAKVLAWHGVDYITSNIIE